MKKPGREASESRNLSTKPHSLFNYACRDPETGSLYPVPPGQFRKTLYCPRCDYQGARCLFAPGTHVEPASLEAEKRKAKRRAVLDRRAARLRRQGLNAGGRPLARTCWNCASIRKTSLGYTCGEGVLLSGNCNAAAMQQQKACKLFQLRTEMEILEFTHDLEKKTDAGGDSGLIN